MRRPNEAIRVVCSRRCVILTVFLVFLHGWSNAKVVSTKPQPIAATRFKDRLLTSYLHNAEKLHRTLVIYAYCEGKGNGGKIDEQNLEYFISTVFSGKVSGTHDAHGRVEYIIVANGHICTPCETTLKRMLSRNDILKEKVTVIYRVNEGMDFGAYREALDYVHAHRAGRYKYYVFINSSLRGPFLPKWTPPDMHFTDTLTNFMESDVEVKLVGSYITCLHAPEPKTGPVMEALFFAVDEESITWLLSDEVFEVRQSKIETILKSEYALLDSVLKRGFKVETLLSRYRPGLDWRDNKHHNCNDCRHASRRGALERGISVNPFEVLFVKTSWCVRAAEAGVLSSWLLRLSNGEDGTNGDFDESGWRFGVSVEGTSGKTGTLPPDVPNDSCPVGLINDLTVVQRD